MIFMARPCARANAGAKVRVRCPTASLCCGQQHAIHVCALNIILNSDLHSLIISKQDNQGSYSIGGKKAK